MLILEVDNDELITNSCQRYRFDRYKSYKNSYDKTITLS